MEGTNENIQLVTQKTGSSKNMLINDRMSIELHKKRSTPGENYRYLLPVEKCFLCLKPAEFRKYESLQSELHLSNLWL